ncbi:MAG: NAD(P)/FAD-dependent oxidoreductase [Candidatus Riflemargulisbacteria bacterium]
MHTLEKLDLRQIQNDFPFVYDVIVIGGGISGLSIAIESADKGLKVILIEETGICSVLEVVSEFKELGILASSDVFDKSRLELLLKQRNIHIKQSKVVSVFELSERVKKVCAIDGMIFGKTVVVATGVTFKKRDIPNATLDLAIDPMMDVVYYMGKNLAVLGNNVHAFRIAEYFSPLVRNVNLILEAEVAEVSSTIVERLYALDNLSIHKQTFFDLIGDGRIEKVILDSGDTLDVDCVFDCSQPIANTAFLEEMGSKGYLSVNDEMETSIPGVYAIGACRLGSNCMSVSAINDAHIATSSIERYLISY